VLAKQHPSSSTPLFTCFSLGAVEPETSIVKEYQLDVLCNEKNTCTFMNVFSDMLVRNKAMRMKMLYKYLRSIINVTQSKKRLKRGQLLVQKHVMQT
jgi:hypothetical protein